MKRIRRVLIIALLALGILTYWSYVNVSAVVHAADYLPVAPVLTAIPAGTEIGAVLSNGITEGTRPGDPITAFVAAPVVVGNVPVLPSGLRLLGTVEHIDKESDGAHVQLRFTEIVMNGKTSAMETIPVAGTTPIKSDLSTLTDALNTLAGAGIGLAMGTASQDPSAAASGLAQGALFGIPGPTRQSPRLTLVLTEPLTIRT
jgi:hypothetical protein